MKFTIKLGDEFKNTKISYSKAIPVTRNYDHSKIIGKAKLNKNNSKLTADVEITDKKEYQKIKNYLDCGIAGTVNKREGNKITDFDIKSVSLKFKDK